MLRRNILIFHNAALGDFLMTWPLALALGRVFAQSRVMFITSSEKGELAEKAIGLESHDAEAGWHALHGDNLTFPPGPTRLLSGLQLAIVFAANRDEKFEQRIRAISGECPILWINPKPPAGVHVLDHQISQLSAAPMLQQGIDQMRHLIDTRGLQAPAGDERRVTLHPGSGAPRKNWPLASFEEVADRLRANGFNITFTIGEVEREQFTSDELNRLEKSGEIKACASLVELYSTIVGGRFYIGNDSGPTHLAAMLGRKTIALFGPTSDVIAWRPVGPAVEVMDFQTTPKQIAQHLEKVRDVQEVSSGSV